MNIKGYENIWVTSDTHIGHKNIVKGVSEWSDTSKCRNFKDTNEMFDCLVKNFNEMIISEDLIIHLGDFNFGSPNNGFEFKEALNCKNIILIRGNHDAKHDYKANPIVNAGYNYDTNKHMFFSDMFLEDCLYKEVFYDKTRICMSHYPMSSWNGMSGGSIMLHGHCHRNKDERFINGGKSMDVGVDGNDMRPYHIDEIMKIMEGKTAMKEGHH